MTSDNDDEDGRSIAPPSPAGCTATYPAILFGAAGSSPFRGQTGDLERNYLIGSAHRR
jgi:hypothetical protein